jgi:hypothetical protein
MKIQFKESMEEQIRNMILNGGWKEGEYDTAKEISSMIIEFIKWKDLNTDFYGDDENEDDPNKFNYIIDSVPTLDWIPLEKLFDYWLKEVKQ